jgi:N-methylhydantoinase B
MWAGVAAVRLGERRLLETIRKYGKSVFLSALETSMDHAERISRSALGRLPNGRFTLDEPQDSSLSRKTSVRGISVPGSTGCFLWPRRWMHTATC